MFKLDMAALRATAKLSANDSPKLAAPLAASLAELAAVSKTANLPFSLEKPKKLAGLAGLAGFQATPANSDPDRWSWPHSSAMNTAEIKTFVIRSNLFNRRGLASLDAESLADKLVNRDREGDNRRACLECRGLSGSGPYQCSPWRMAGLGGPMVARQLVTMLQRCKGFALVN